MKKLWLILIVFSAFNIYGQTEYLNKQVSLSVDSVKLDFALDILSKQCDCYFTYDAQKINGNSQVSIHSNQQPLLLVLDNLIDDANVVFTEFKNQVVISTPQITKNNETQRKPSSNLLIRGQIVDVQTKEPLPFATIAIKGAFLGTICNEKGYFSINIPEKYSNDTLAVSYVGYYNAYIPILKNKDKDIILGLLQGAISIQEIVVRHHDPIDIIKRSIKNIDDNYQTQPYNYEAFYREGVEKGKEYILYTEALLEGYRPKLHGMYSNDKLQVVHSRKFSNIHNEDTVAVKVSSGLESCINLDIIDNIPDFLRSDGIANYAYNLADILVWEQTLVYQIDFKQKPYVDDLLLEGSLYISMDDYAIIGAEFGYTEEKIKNKSSSFVLKKSRKIKVKPKGSFYRVSYKKSGDKYYLSHVRAKLLLNVKKKRLQFSKNYAILIEMAITDIKNNETKSQFNKDNLIKKNSIFSESKFIYEHNYWGNNNTIQPELNILNAFEKAGLRVSEVKSSGVQNSSQ